MHRSTLPTLAVIALLIILLGTPAAHAGRALEPGDWYRFKAVSDLVISPDGGSVAYVVTSYDKASDKSRGALWLAAWNGKESLQLTHGESVSVPRFSPDGRYLSFLSARPGDGSTQLWLLDRRGGEPRQLTHVPGQITDYAWSRDGAHVVLVVSGAEGDGETRPPKPMVIDSLLFKQDTEGYLTDNSRPAFASSQSGARLPGADGGPDELGLTARFLSGWPADRLR